MTESADPRRRRRPVWRFLLHHAPGFLSGAFVVTVVVAALVMLGVPPFESPGDVAPSEPGAPIAGVPGAPTDPDPPTPDPVYLPAEQRLMETVFTRPVVGQFELKFPGTTTHREVREHVDRLLIPTRLFFGAGDRLELEEWEAPIDGVVQGNASLAGHELEAYAYQHGQQQRQKDCGVLVIPAGYDVPPANSILRGEGDYGDIADVLSESCDVFVYIKPNEDYLSIHNGHGMQVTYDYIYHHLLNRGGSYHATYLIEAMALIRHLQQRYPDVGVAGLSQGGEAAHWVALETAPDFAIVASGFSVLQRELTWSGYSQIVIPDLYRRYPLAAVRQRMTHAGTHYLVTFGAADSAVYRTDADEQRTCEYLQSGPPAPFADRVHCVVHPDAHIFPTAEIRAFLDNL